MPESNETRERILRIAEIIIEELKLEEITSESFDPDMDLVDELGVDSMDLATVVLVLQDEYGVFIDEDDYPKLKTIRMIAEYLQSRLQGRKG
ncbi:MAG: phosphopantetheine-binding protein [Deltaproteobacteria bacterium]|jgi:acyl carrier protein|nr:phosphopantetheine-binding protein [Deltaproteobacteria bacterium]